MLSFHFISFRFSFFHFDFVNLFNDFVKKTWILKIIHSFLLALHTINLLQHNVRMQHMLATEQKKKKKKYAINLV